MKLQLLALSLITAVAFAQSDRGTLTGTIADPTGSVVASAPIQARNTQTGAIYEAATSSTGNYTIAQLPVGTYELSATVTGFKKYIRQGLDVGVAQTLRIDITLEVGAATESVTVTEAAPLLKTESGELSHNVASQTLNQLPILGIGAGAAGSSGIRNPNAVIQLIPGTYYTANSEIRINGAPDNTQAYRIEGMDASSGGTPGTPAQQQPSVDAIQEVAVQTSNYAAEFGQAGGGVFNVTMKSGTNQFHGTAYDYFVNEALNASSPFTSVNGAPNVKSPQRRNDYGFTIGGPVVIPKLYNGHDKTFFFFNWEQFRETQSVNNISQTVPLAEYRLGDFRRALTTRNLGTDPLGRSMPEGTIYDPTTTRNEVCVAGASLCTAGALVSVRDPFPNNMIPANRFDPVAAKIQALVPQPTNLNASTLNFLPTFKATRVSSIPAVKLDHQLSAKAKLSFYYSKTGTTAPISAGLGQADGLPDPISTSIGTFTYAHVFRLNFDYTLSPTMLLHLGAGYQGVDQGVPSVKADGSRTDFDQIATLGLKGATINGYFPSIQNALNASTGGLKNIGSGSDSHNYTQKPTFNASVTWVKGNHTYKFGSELRIEGYPAAINNSVNGVYGFSAQQTSLPYLQANTLLGTTPGFAYASFLLGLVNNGTIGYRVTPKLGKDQLGIFVQDTWKVTRKFTLDYGLRYDYSTYLSEQYGRAANFSATTINPKVGIPGALLFEGDGPGKCNCRFAKNYPWAFGPRLGAAYQLNEKTVLRGGFGIVYNGTAQNNNSAGGLASATNSFSSSVAGSPVLQLADGIGPQFLPAPWPNFDAGLYPVNPSSAPVPLPSPRIDQNSGRPARQYQWSFGVQRQITKDLVIEASYVANRGVWWTSNALLNLNAIDPKSLASRGIDINNTADAALLALPLNNATIISRGLNKLPYPTFPVGQSLGQSLRPFPQFTTINSYWAPLGKTWYDSLQMKGTKRFSHGLSFTTIFVWSRSLQQGAEREANPGTNGNAAVNDVFNRDLNKYLSLHDQPFLFNIAPSYTTQAMNRGPKWLSTLVKDWNLGAFLQYASGLPIQVPTANNNLNSQIFQPTFANRVPGEPLLTVDLNCHCYDPANTFVLNPKAWVNPPAGQFSSSPAYYTDYRKQRRPSESINFGRTFAIHEGVSLQIRAEFSNMFNRYIVNNPASTNAEQAPARDTRTGTTTGGFGFIDRTTQQGGAGIGALVNIAPRNGTLVARIRF